MSSRGRAHTSAAPSEAATSSGRLQHSIYRAAGDVHGVAMADCCLNVDMDCQGHFSLGVWK